MEQRETEQRNGTNGIEMERILAWHGYHSPVPVGEGSFSQVYRVTDSSGEFRACRVSDVTEQWQRECENWQEIRHPLFPGYVEHWTEGGKGYLIMEFWDGMDLRKMLERRGRLTPGHAAWIADQIAEGIQYLHERQHPFLYRDLKPENIRIRVNGRVGILGSGMPVEQRRKMVGSRQLFLQCAGTVPTGGDTRGGKRCVCHGKIVGGHAGRENGKHNRQEKWLRRISRMATHTERQRRIPDMKTFRRLLSVMNASGRVRRQVFKESDFYYIRKLYCP